MGSFHLRDPLRSVYPVSDFTFSGIPQFLIEGDVPPETEIHFSMTVRENNVTDIRSYLTNEQGFAGSIVYNDVEVDFQFARLVEPLHNRDHGGHNLRVVFSVKREFIRRLQRPMGRQPVDYEAIKQAQIYSFSLDADVLRRRRLELDAASAALHEYSVSLAAAEEELEERRKQLDAA